MTIGRSPFSESLPCQSIRFWPSAHSGAPARVRRTVPLPHAVRPRSRSSGNFTVGAIKGEPDHFLGILTEMVIDQLGCPCPRTFIRGRPRPTPVMLRLLLKPQEPCHNTLRCIDPLGRPRRRDVSSFRSWVGQRVGAWYRPDAVAPVTVQEERLVEST